jgi:hypothetical protein
MLQQEGIPAMVNPEDAVSFLGVSSFPCRLLVPPNYLKQAQEVLNSLQPQTEEPE